MRNGGCGDRARDGEARRRWIAAWPNTCPPRTLPRPPKITIADICPWFNPQFLSRFLSSPLILHPGGWRESFLAFVTCTVTPNTPPECKKSILATGAQLRTPCNGWVYRAPQPPSWWVELRVMELVFKVMVGVITVKVRIVRVRVKGVRVALVLWLGLGTGQMSAVVIDGGRFPRELSGRRSNAYIRPRQQTDRRSMDDGRQLRELMNQWVQVRVNKGIYFTSHLSNTYDARTCNAPTVLCINGTCSSRTRRDLFHALIYAIMWLSHHRGLYVSSRV